MATYVGDRLEAGMQLYDVALAPITGATFTVNSYYGPSGAMSVGLVAVVELGNGIYRIQSEPVTVSGTYTIVVTPNVAAPNNVPQAAVWDVDPLWNFTFPTVVNDGMTRREIRRDILRVFGDLLVVTATANGSTTTFVDVDNLVYEPAAYASMYGMLTGGTAANLGQIRFIKSSSQDNSRVTFSRALPQATQAGDEMELTNSMGQGVRFADVHDAIDRAIRIAQRDLLVPVIANALPVFDNDTRTITLPNNIAGVDSVQYKSRYDSTWRIVQPAASYGEHGWFLDDVAHGLFINGNEAVWLDDLEIRVNGLAMASLLETDSDRSKVDPEWVVAQCLADLTSNLVARGPRTEKWYAASQEYKAKANMLYTRLVPNLQPTTRMFR